jgi:hypothetical protein
MPNRQITRDIRPDEWIPFLAEFTRENRGAHARLEIVGADADVGYQVETENRTFDGISVDDKNGERAVWIAFGSSAADHLTHGADRATAIRTLSASGISGAILEVETADGVKTILILSNPGAYALPAAGSSNQTR